MTDIEPAVNSADPTIGGAGAVPPGEALDALAPSGGAPSGGRKSMNYWQLVWRQFRRSYLGMVGLALVLMFILLAIFAPFITNKYPYFWHSAEDGLIFPLFRALTNQDLILLLAFVMAVLVPVTKLIIDRIGWRFWNMNRLRRAVLINLLVLLAGSGLLMLKPETYRIMRQVGQFSIERDFREDLQRENAGRITAMFPPVRYAPSDQFVAERFTTPSWQHPLGTDAIGRSNVARIIYGTRLALFVGFISVGLSTLIGLLIGGVSGYFSGWPDLIIQRLVEIWSAFPSLFLLLTIIALWGPKLIVIMVAIGLTSWTGTARLIRANVLQVRTLDFITAARAMGARTLPIVFRHALPNSIAPVLVSVSFGIAGAVFLESTLSFLGLSDPDYPSWGALLNQARSIAIAKPSLLVIPGVTIFLAVLAYNLMGEGLRDALDPRMKN